MANLAARMSGLPEWEALGVAKAARWLAMIRRDHGQEEFEKQAKVLGC